MAVLQTHNVAIGGDFRDRGGGLVEKLDIGVVRVQGLVCDFEEKQVVLGVGHWVGTGAVEDETVHAAGNRGVGDGGLEMR